MGRQDLARGVVEEIDVPKLHLRPTGGKKRRAGPVLHLPVLEKQPEHAVHVEQRLLDVAITLSCPGPAPLWPGDVPGKPLAPRPTGDSVFNTPSSLLFAPAVTMPLLSVGGMPVGVQLMGQKHSDARITALARWMLGSIAPVIAR